MQIKKIVLNAALCFTFFCQNNFIFADYDLDKVLDGITEVNKNDYCKFDTNSSYTFKLVRQPSRAMLSTLSTISCASVFSENIPENFADINYSKKVFWSPFCSIKDVKALNMKGDSIEKSFITSQENLLARDACATPPSQSRFSREYKPPTQNQAGMVPLTNSEISNEVEDYKHEVKKIQNIAKSSCCNGDQNCIILFDKIKFKYCENKTDPDEPDNCLDKGAFFNHTGDDNFIHAVNRINEKKSKEKFPELVSGEISLSLFVDKKTRIANDNLNIITHELGHACSFFKAEIDAQKGVKSALKWLNKDLLKKAREDLKQQISSKSNICQIEDSDVEEYKRRLGQLNLSKQSIECMLNNSKNAVNKRYETGVCDDGCPFAFIEEFFADSFATTTMMQNYLPSFMFTLCGGYRDQEHPAGNDNVACMLKTTSIVDKLKETLKCKESR